MKHLSLLFYRFSLKSRKKKTYARLMNAKDTGISELFVHDPALNLVFKREMVSWEG
jgi:hypothetical protein